MIVSNAKEGQVQEVFSEDQEELVVDCRVGDETLMKTQSSLYRETTGLSVTLSITDQVQKPVDLSL